MFRSHIDSEDSDLSAILIQPSNSNNNLPDVTSITNLISGPLFDDIKSSIDINNEFNIFSETLTQQKILKLQAFTKYENYIFNTLQIMRKTFISIDDNLYKSQMHFFSSIIKKLVSKSNKKYKTLKNESKILQQKVKSLEMKLNVNPMKINEITYDSSFYSTDDSAEMDFTRIPKFNLTDIQSTFPPLDINPKTQEIKHKHKRHHKRHRKHKRHKKHKSPERVENRCGSTDKTYIYCNHINLVTKEKCGVCFIRTLRGIPKGTQHYCKAFPNNKLITRTIGNIFSDCPECKLIEWHDGCVRSATAHEIEAYLERLKLMGLMPSGRGLVPIGSIQNKKQRRRPSRKRRKSKRNKRSFDIVLDGNINNDDIKRRKLNEVKEERIEDWTFDRQMAVAFQYREDIEYQFNSGNEWCFYCGAKVSPMFTMVDWAEYFVCETHQWLKSRVSLDPAQKLMLDIAIENNPDGNRLVVDGECNSEKRYFVHVLKEMQNLNGSLTRELPILRRKSQRMANGERKSYVDESESWSGEVSSESDDEVIEDDSDSSDDDVPIADRLMISTVVANHVVDDSMVNGDECVIKEEENVNGQNVDNQNQGNQENFPIMRDFFNI